MVQNLQHKVKRFIQKQGIKIQKISDPTRLVKSQHEREGVDICRKLIPLKETKLLNFYSATGLQFYNIASNDAVVMSKINELATQGWELKFVNSGVESDAGKSDGKGIFVTRYIFFKP